MKRLLPFLLFLLPFVAQAESLHFPYNPALSPDGKTIYFSYDGDIFTVPAEGGMAMRFVSLGAIESPNSTRTARPKFSSGLST